MVFFFIFKYQAVYIYKIAPLFFYLYIGTFRKILQPGLNFPNLILQKVWCWRAGWF